MKRKILAFALSVVTLLSVGLTAIAAPAETSTYIENADGSVYYSFSEANDWGQISFNGNAPKFCMQNYERTQSTDTEDKTYHATFLQSDSDGKNTSGMMRLMKNEYDKTNGTKTFNALRGINFTGKEDKNVVIRARIRYANVEDLNTSQCFVRVEFQSGFNNSLPLYDSPSCKGTPSQTVGYGNVYAIVNQDINGSSLADGEWHTVEAVIPVKGGKHRDGKYADMSVLTSTALNFYPFAANNQVSNTTYFTQSYIDECTENGTVPTAEILLDDFEMYFETKDGTTATPGINKKHTFTTANTNTTVSSSVVSVDKNAHLRFSGEIKFANPENYRLDRIGIYNYLLITAGNATVYTTEACDTEASFTGNALYSDGLNVVPAGSLVLDENNTMAFSRIMSTSNVWYSSNKKVYFQPYTAKSITQWLRIGESADATKLSLEESKTIFSADYLTSLGYENVDGIWTRAADSEITDLPTFTYTLSNVKYENFFPDVPQEPFGVSEATVTGSNIEGATATVDYAIADSYTEGDSRVYIKENGNVVAAAKATGSFSYTFPENSVGKTYTYEIVPGVGGVYGTAYTGTLGTVVDKFTAEKTTNGVTWSYDATVDTENTVVLVALYNVDGEMIALDPVDIVAGQTYSDSLTQETATLAKVFHWVDTENATPIVKNFEFELN